MGVPKFFRWMSERYPAISQLIAENRIPEFDCLYLDMNGIIHNCTHKDSDSPSFRMTEDKMFIAIFNYIEHLFGKIKPKKLFFMAIDGVAPRAKMNQQRSRRFRTALDAEKARDKAIKEGLELPKEEPFDSNCITPGTEFMAKLTKQLKYFISKKVSEDVEWQGVEVVLSGHEVPGEGEHKIMEYIRQAKAQPGYDPNVRHCLYGLDADLIMLGLLSHDPHFCLLREEVTFGRSSQKKSKELEHQNFYLMHLCVVREYLELEFQDLQQEGALDFEYDMERIIDDFILMAFFVGNDFLPNLPNLHINEGALALMFQKYKQILPTLGGYINEQGVINLQRMEVLLDELSEVEHRFFEAEYADSKWIDAKRNGQAAEKPLIASRGPVRISPEQKKIFNNVKKFFISPVNKDPATRQPFNLPPTLPARDRKFVQQLATDLNLQWSTKEDEEGNRFLQLEFPPAPQAEDSDDEDEESQLATMRVLKRYEHAKVEQATDEQAQKDMEQKYDQKFRDWKDTYYKEKFGWGLENEGGLRHLTENYVQGLQWVLFYYYRGVASWPWFYQYHYSPMISDVKKGLGADMNFQLGQPFRPFQQLMGVLPDRSKKIVPTVYHDLMTSKDSPIIDFYPRDFELDMNGKKQEWEAVVKIPFIEEQRLLSAMAPKDALLSEEERLRNDFGVSLKFVYSPEVDYIYPSSLVGIFPDLPHCRCIQNEFELPTMDGLEPYVGLVEGVKLGVAALAGFPSLKTLPFTASLGFHGVSVFQQDSRNESMVVTVSDTETRAKVEFAKVLLNKRVHVGYPFLQEAKVVKVSDELFDYVQITTDGDAPHQVKAIEHSGKEIDDFHRKAERIEKYYSKRLGMLIGDVESLVHVEMLKGLKKLDDGSTVKEFAEMPGLETIHATQVVVENVISEDVRFIEQAALPIEEEFPEGTNAFFLGDYAYGRPLSVVGHENGKAKCLIALSKGSQVEFGRDIARQAERLSPYVPSYQIAQSLSLNALALAKITSSFSVRVDDQRVNLGLNLKFEAKKLKVLGYSRKRGSGWEFSQAAIQLIQQYMIRFPQFIAGIHNNPQGDMLPATAYFPGSSPEEAKAKIKEIQTWLKEIESKSFERVPLEAEQLDSEIVKLIEQAADEALRTEPPPENKTLGGVPRNGLLKPSDAQWRLGNQNFGLGDRVIYVADSGKVPIASKGTIVGLTLTTRETWLDVVFDVSFMSGTSLGDRCSPFRGSTVPTWSVLNLSNRQVVASSQASATRQTNRAATPLTVPGYGLPGINGQGQLRPAQAPPALRGSWRGAVSGQGPGRGNVNGTAGRGQQNGRAMPFRNGPPTNGSRGNVTNGQYPSGGRGGMGHVSRAGYTVVDRGDPQAGVVQHNPNFRLKAQNHVPPPSSLDQPSTPRGRGRGRGGASRGGRGATPRGTS
ncbi:alkaline phosphatase D [Cladophialophora yegresii CBS 114405]|uniref:5'-3' exoribonuclease 1 n=1 Tax=Cladophialophora yegresii CBS 114405 TaxID=1182544 RepID=W9VXQ9_9EURO|nr:alkaline phosphatase D [Cladophialophora yegresii CBS 114405]EXJ60448.1 alkaline phosphatase D [Cladophialophora yegresii CBS 114405]